MNIFHKKRASCVLIIDLESQTYLSVFKDNYNYNIPGGKCFINETDIDCAIREIQEETGLFLDPNYMSLLMAEQCEDYFVSTYLTYIWQGDISTEEEHSVDFVPLKNLLINKNYLWIKYHNKLLNQLKALKAKDIKDMW
jgi:ADP-ribose pyrophosphatase YjhB (NUDIX family)